jgi:hypothetical protein
MGQPTWTVFSPLAGPSILAKFPDENRVFNFDFSRVSELVAGATGVSVVISPTPELNNLTLGSPTIDASGTLVSIPIAAGGANITYLLECVLTLSSGSVVTGLGLLLIVNPDVYAVPPPQNANIGVVPDPTFVMNPLGVDLDAANHRISNLPDPIANGDAASQGWVLASVSGVTIRGGSGAPVNGSDPDGSFYFQGLGGTLSTIYVAHMGAWVGIV